MKNKTIFKAWIVDFLASPFSWSKWVDICTFSFGGNAFLLQGKVNYKTNLKKFKVTAMKGIWRAADVKSMKMETLEECGLISRTLKHY